MYLNPTDKHWILDLETDGLRDECTRIFVVCVEHATSSERLSFRTKEDFLSWLDREYILVGHNLVAFDVPVLNRLWGAGIGISRCVDTFVLSMLYSPNFEGGHSLEAWGQRLKFPKLEYKDFTQYSDEMLEYCENDVALTKKLFLRLTKRMRDVGFTELGAEIETLSWHIIQNKQRRHGFPFDYKRALELYTTLRAREEALKNEIHQQWPPILSPIKTLSRANKKDGSSSADYLRCVEQFPKIETHSDGSFTVFDYVEFNLGSPPQRIAKLLEAGWAPTAYTKAGNPKVDEESLIRFAETSGNEGARTLAKWIVTNSRANMINTWLNAYNEKTGAIHGSLWLAGSLRYRHDNPNSANIPAVRVDDDGPRRGENGSWTYESRDLWTCGDPDVYELVGVDAKGIQLRILAHYLNDEEFNKAILSADPHTYNQNAWGLDTRAKAKTILYAIVMGAGDGRVSSEANISLKEAKATKKQLFDRVPGFPKLIGRLQNEWKRTGRIKLCDGTPVLVPKDYRVIPFLLQGDESKIMKMASILLDKEIRRNKLEAYKVADVHDEWQFVVRKEHVAKFEELALGVFPAVARIFNYTIELAGDAKVGKTWAETH